MEEDAFRNALKELNSQKCAFEKAILSQKHACKAAKMFYLANRHGCNCSSEANAQRCETLLQTLREKAKFALHLKKITPPLPHAKEIRVQLGGLIGLNKVLNQSTDNITNIDGIVEQTYHVFEDLKEIPFEAIINEIQKIESLRRGKKGK